MDAIIDAEELQKRKAMPRYKIREEPIKCNPCGCICPEYQRGDCPGEVWACLVYRKYRSE